MEKHKLGWLINGCLVGATIITGIIFPNPAVIFPVVAKEPQNPHKINHLHTRQKLTTFCYSSQLFF